MSNRNPPEKKRAQFSTAGGLKRRGAKERTTRNEIPKDEWYALCLKKNSTEAFKRMSNAQFLKSSESGNVFTGTVSQQMSFGRYLKQFENGELEPSGKKRSRESKYKVLEDKLVEYIRLCQQLYQTDKCGLSWLILQKKLLHWAKLEEDEVYSDFQASPSFISRVLRTHNLIGVSLHGEANDMDDETREGIMLEWWGKFWAKLRDRNIRPECLYNADQTGLFYNKMPNRMYIERERRKEFKGVKAMKSKDRITLMVCTSCNGNKVPLAVIGKAKQPTCFRLCPNGIAPLPYRAQKNAWFDKEVTMWWILHVFWPYHLKEQGDVPACLLFDNCAVQSNLDFTLLPRNLDIDYFPVNVTNRHQPADMGIIASLKVGYKLSMLEMLLTIFDVEGGYQQAAAARARQTRGCRGLQYGGKAHILDAMVLLDNIWGRDGKYAAEDSVRCCWRKADILPPTWMADINNEVGSASLPEREKRISVEDCDQLCHLMKLLTTKAEESGLDTSREGYAMEGSFVAQHVMDDADLREIAEKWVDVESDESVQEDEVDEAIDELDKKLEEEEDFEASDEDPMEYEEIADASDLAPNITFLEASAHIETLRCFGTSIGANSEDLDLLSKLERSFRRIQLSKQRSQPTLARYFESVHRPSSPSVDRGVTGQNV
jgi:hypothetical protein